MPATGRRAPLRGSRVRETTDQCTTS